MADTSLELIAQRIEYLIKDIEAFRNEYKRAEDNRYKELNEFKAVYNDHCKDSDTKFSDVEKEIAGARGFVNGAAWLFGICFTVAQIITVSFFSWVFTTINVHTENITRLQGIDKQIEQRIDQGFKSNQYGR